MNIKRLIMVGGVILLLSIGTLLIAQLLNPEDFGNVYYYWISSFQFSFLVLVLAGLFVWFLVYLARELWLWLRD